MLSHENPSALRQFSTIFLTAGFPSGTTNQRVVLITSTERVEVAQKLLVSQFVPWHMALGQRLCDSFEVVCLFDSSRFRSEPDCTTGIGPGLDNLEQI
jgi:hypothetical protein